MKKKKDRRWVKGSLGILRVVIYMTVLELLIGLKMIFLGDSEIHAIRELLVVSVAILAYDNLTIRREVRYKDRLDTEIFSNFYKFAEVHQKRITELSSKVEETEGDGRK